MSKRKKRHLKKFIKIFLVILVTFIVLNYSIPKIKKILYTNIEVKEVNKINEKPLNIEDIDLDENLPTLEKLQILKEYDNRINKIIDNYDEYPLDLLENFTRDLDLLDFVLDYPFKYGNTYSDNVGSVEKGVIPLLIQWDERWGYYKYGETSIAIEGCGPTALAMVISGLTGNNKVTPTKIADFSLKNGYYVNGTGTSWDLMTKGAEAFGLTVKEIPLAKNTIYNALENGHPIICSMRPGDFTRTGHFIVLVGIENDKIKVNDPNSKKRSSKLWTYEELKTQIKNLWEFTI